MTSAAAGRSSIPCRALLLTISKGGSWGWSSERSIFLLVLTVAVLAVWVPYSLRVNQPLVDLRTSVRRPILLTNIASILVGFALMANMLISIQQLQQPAAGSGFGLSAVIDRCGVIAGPWQMGRSEQGVFWRAGTGTPAFRSMSREG